MNNPDKSKYGQLTNEQERDDNAKINNRSYAPNAVQFKWRLGRWSWMCYSSFLEYKHIQQYLIQA